MPKLLILSIHLLFSTIGTLEYCLSKGMRRLKYKPVSHYAARLYPTHPAYQNIMIFIAEGPKEPSLKSHMLCTSLGNKLPLLITGTLSLN